RKTERGVLADQSGLARIPSAPLRLVKGCQLIAGPQCGRLGGVFGRQHEEGVGKMLAQISIDQAAPEHGLADCPVSLGSPALWAGKSRNPPRQRTLGGVQLITEDRSGQLIVGKYRKE